MVQEQHPDRTRLYRQWRQLDWPIVVDSLNTLRHVTVVPIPMAIDENGIVVHENFRPNELEDFVSLSTSSESPAAEYNRTTTPDLTATPSNADEWRSHGEVLFNFGQPGDLTEAINAFESAITLNPSDGFAEFALGASLRRRYESEFRKPGDAQAAVQHWGRSLDIDPNHYIRRRRLQQYGPRLDKPYNFYFWVNEARDAITARGDTPHPLTAEPMGSEIAPPQKDTQDATAAPATNRDPEGRINRDEKGLVEIETLVTPWPVQPGQRVRVRATFRLRGALTPWWNNEADNLMLWPELPEGIEHAEGTLQFTNPTEPETQELRQIEFELSINENISHETVRIPAYALYYVCENTGGVCYYLRQDFQISLQLRNEATPLK